MEAIILLILIVGVGYYLFRQGKVQGSRRGFSAGRRCRRFRR